MQQLELFSRVRKRPSRRQPQEWKVVSCRECPTLEQQQLCETPWEAVDYWRNHVAKHPYFNPDCECLVVLLLTSRRRIRGHHLVALGSLDSIHVHPREVFRAAIICAAHAVVVMHNHPSGDPTPSFGDFRVTHDLKQAGTILKIEVLDHIIIGNPRFVSLKQLGQI